MLDIFLSSQAWISLATLTLMEIVLGIDNLVFVAILSENLKGAERQKARRVGLILAMLVRVLLLFAITWVMGLTATLFSLLDHAFSGRDLILLIGGLFLIAKSTSEIHHKIADEQSHGEAMKKKAQTFLSVITQIVILDVVFSLDSVITAVGMADSILIMVLAVMIAITVMLIFMERISRFIEKHPTLKVLALSFLLLIGTALMADGFHLHIPKGYIYSAMAFSLFVEMINLRVRQKAKKS
jgi:predicted tellurium resistance membrane protein TerC